MKECRNEGCKNIKSPDRAECASCRGKRRRGTNYVTKWKSGGGSPKILFLDIETAPDLAYVWKFFKENVGLQQVKENGEMICFAASWYGSEEMMFWSKYKHSEEAMAKAAWELLDEADIVVHYYGSGFDIPWLNRTYLKLGMLPPSPFKQVDLKNVVSKRFYFPSNKLQYVSTFLGLPGKLEHEGFDLWKKCMAGDIDAQKRMEDYNKQDVFLLEELYEILLPWLPDHPNRHLYNGEGGCPRCGIDGAIKDAGFAYTRCSKFQQYRCHLCGSYFRDPRRIEAVQIQDSLL